MDASNSDHKTIKETAESWCVTRRYVNLCITGGRIPGVMRMGNMWIVPANATKPSNLRKSRGECGETKDIVGNKPKEFLSDDLDCVCEATIKPFPHDNPDAFGRKCYSHRGVALATAYVSAFAPDMVPDWLKNGDFSNTFYSEM